MTIEITSDLILDFLIANVIWLFAILVFFSFFCFRIKSPISFLLLFLASGPVGWVLILLKMFFNRNN